MVPRVSSLYPPVQFPVSRGTPSLAPLVSWDHSRTWALKNQFHLDEMKAMKRNVCLSLNSESYRMLKSYLVNGHVVLPVAAILVLVWKELGNSFSRNFSKMPVVFNNMMFPYVPVFPEHGSLDIYIFLQRTTGNFEIFETEKKQIFAKGQVRAVEHIGAEFSAKTEFHTEGSEKLTSEDVYCDLEQRGIKYGEDFRRIREVNLCSKGSEALISYCEDWVVSIDSLLQLAVLQSTENSQHLHLPVFIRKVVIDPLGENADHTADAKVAMFHNFTNTARSGSIELSGIKTKRVHLERPLTVSIITTNFVPFNNSQFQTPCEFINRAIKFSSENKFMSSKGTLIITILVNEKTASKIEPQFEKIFKENKHVKVLSVTANQNLTEATVGDLLLASDGTLEQGVVIMRNSGVFLLASTSSDKHVKHHRDVAVIDEQCFENRKWIFMKTCAAVNKSTPVVFMSKIESLKPSKIFVDETSTTYVVTRNNTLDEVKAIVTNIKAGKIHYPISYRFIFIVDRDAPLFSLSTFFYEKQLKRGLVVNVYYNGCWGSLMDVQVPCVPDAPHTNFIKLISSLRMTDFNWIFTGVNSRNLETEILEDSVVGVVDMSGHTVDGQRVMCVAGVKPGCVEATTVPHLTWSVPEGWSLEDAATVPVAYSLAYYALILKADARRGESILVHAGHTPIGQAFISVALHKGLEVSTTVYNNKQRLYLREKFPQILGSSIFNWKDTCLEREIQTKSKNKGFRIIVNPLEERFLQMSMNSVGLFGRLLQLSTTEMEQHKEIGMEPFLKNVGVISVIPEWMFEINQVWKERLHGMVVDGIKRGVVQPLDRKVFTVVKGNELFSTLHDPECIEKVLVAKDSYGRQQVTRGLRILSRSSYSKKAFSFGCKSSSLVVGDSTENYLVLAEWLASQGCCNITICCNSSAITPLTNRHIRGLATHSNVSIDIVSLEKTYTLEHTSDLLRSINSAAPLSAVFVLPVKDSLTVHLLEVALCDVELGAPTVVLINSDITTVQHMRNSTGLPIFDLQTSSSVKQTTLHALFRVLDQLLLSQTRETMYLSVEDKRATSELLSPEEQLPVLLPSSVEQLERLGEDLMSSTSCSLEEVCSKSPGLSHVREVQAVFIIPGLLGPAKSTAQVLARNLMCPAVVVKLPGGTDSMQDNVTAIIKAIKDIQPKGPYNIVGISWGGIYAIELARQLQAAGEVTRVFLIEGAPQTNQDIARLLGDGDQLQVNLLTRLLNLTQSSIHKDLLSSPDWRVRVHRALSELPQKSALSKQYLTCALEALYRRLQTLLCYKPDGLLLSGQVVLIRPNKQSNNTCGLEKVFKESPNVLLVDSDHKCLLESSEVANVISDLTVVDLYWIKNRDIDAS